MSATWYRTPPVDWLALVASDDAPAEWLWHLAQARAVLARRDVYERARSELMRHPSPWRVRPPDPGLCLDVEPEPDETWPVFDSGTAIFEGPLTVGGGGSDGSDGAGFWTVKRAPATTT